MKYGYLTVRARHSKNSKSRNVPLTSRALQMLKRRKGADCEGPVFRRPDGSCLCQTWLNEQQRKIRELLGLHSLRHTFGTPRRVRGRRVHYNEAHAAQYDYGLAAVRPPVSRISGTGRQSNGGSEYGEVERGGHTFRHTRNGRRASCFVTMCVFNQPGWRNRQTQRT